VRKKIASGGDYNSGRACGPFARIGARVKRPHPAFCTGEALLTYLGVGSLVLNGSGSGNTFIVQSTSGKVAYRSYSILQLLCNSNGNWLLLFLLETIVLFG
jgi:hypothetical protein